MWEIAVGVVAGAFVILTVLHIALRRPKYSLVGKHVMITGGSSGIGLCAAKECISRGASAVSILARNQQRLDAAEKDLAGFAKSKGKEVRITAVSADVTSAESVSAACATLRSAAGDVDVLITSAGNSGPQRVEDTTLADYQSIMNVNWMGTVIVIKEVLPQMRERRSGRILLISSQAGQVGVYGFTAYSSSKFALRGLAESLRQECLPYGISVGMHCPPDTDTPLLERENKQKPIECQRISQTSGLFTAEQVAKDVVNGVETGRFVCYTGMDGWALSIATAGMGPMESVFSTCVEVLLLPIMRLVAVFTVAGFHKIIREEFAKRNKK